MIFFKKVVWDSDLEVSQVFWSRIVLLADLPSCLGGANVRSCYDSRDIPIVEDVLVFLRKLSVDLRR